MPTNLPERSRGSIGGRHRDAVSKTGAALMLWALTMIALTIPMHPAYTADADSIEIVLR